jgi:hypothetical protein
MKRGEFPVDEFSKKAKLDYLSDSSDPSPTFVARERAGLYFTLLLDDLETWFSELGEHLSAGKLDYCAMTHDSWELTIWAPQFWALPEIQALELDNIDNEKWPRVNNVAHCGQVGVPLCCWAPKENLIYLLPSNPIISKRLQLFGLRFCITGNNSKPSPPKSNTLVLSFLKLLTDGPSSLLRIEDPAFSAYVGERRSLANEDFVNFLYSHVFPVPNALVHKLDARRRTKETRKARLQEAKMLYKQARIELEFGIDFQSN